nr:hypothetical protein [Tanacetum cinerariifolium]
MAKLIKNNRILLNNNIFPHKEASMEVLLAKERILKLIQAWDDKQIESWSFLELLPQLLNDSQTIDEMLKQREQATNLAFQKKQEEQAAQSFIPYWNFSMIDDEEVLQSREKFMKAIQTFLQKFSLYPFGVMPKVLSIAWERFSEIKYAFTDKQYQPEEIQELMCKLLEDVQNIRDGLAKYINSPSWNHPTFYDDDEEHSIQHKEYLENSSNAIAPVLLTEEPEYSLSMGYEHLSTTPETKDEIIKSSVKNLVPIPSGCEVNSDKESECDVPICEDSSTFDVLKDHYKILSDSNNDDILSDDDAFEDIEYVEASPLDSELVSLEEENDVYQEEKEFNLEDILQIQDVILCEKLLSINRLIADIDSLNDNRTPDRVLKSSASIHIFEKSDNSLSYSDNSSPEFETFSDHTEETRSEVDLFLALDNSIPPGIENFDYDSEGDIHFLEELLGNDSIPFPENESSNFDHQDDPSFPRPPPEPPDVEFFFDFEPNSGELISAMIKILMSLLKMNVLTQEVSPLLLSTGSEDTIFDPGIAIYSQWHLIGMELSCALMFI